MTTARATTPTGAMYRSLVCGASVRWVVIPNRSHTWRRRARAQMSRQVPPGTAPGSAPSKVAKCREICALVLITKDQNLVSRTRGIPVVHPPESARRGPYDRRTEDAPAVSGRGDKDGQYQRRAD